MHELSLIRTLLQQVEEIQALHKDCALRRINVSIGEFSGVDPQLLELGFGQITESTPLDGVEFAVQRVPLRAECRRCGCEFRVEKFQFVCPTCAGTAADI